MKSGKREKRPTELRGRGEGQANGVVKSTEMNEGVGGRTQVHTDRFDTRQVHKPTLRLLAYHDELNSNIGDRWCVP